MSASKTDLAVADLYQHKVRKTRHKLQAHSGEFALQQLPAGGGDFPRPSLVLSIAHSGECTGLSYPIYIERLTRFLQDADQLRLWRGRSRRANSPNPGSLKTCAGRRHCDLPGRI
jgi:hypothetical protein